MKIINPYTEILTTLDVQENLQSLENSWRGGY